MKTSHLIQFPGLWVRKSHWRKVNQFSNFFSYPLASQKKDGKFCFQWKGFLPGSILATLISLGSSILENKLPVDSETCSWLVPLITSMTQMQNDSCHWAKTSECWPPMALPGQRVCSPSSPAVKLWCVCPSWFPFVNLQRWGKESGTWIARPGILSQLYNGETLKYLHLD